MEILNKVTGYFGNVDSSAPKLCGQHTDTFCYRSIRDRHPVSITKVIDQMYSLGIHDPSLAEDTKAVTAKLSRLKSRLQTDKEIELLEGEGDDIEMWNKAISELQTNSWFKSPWLVVECYMYRYIHQCLQTTSSFTYPHYDIFRQEKEDGLQESLDNLAVIAGALLSPHSDIPARIADYIRVSLWGNKADLSILKHFNLNLADVQSACVDKLSDMDSEILNNDMEKVVQYISSLQGAKVDVVLDNAGYELFGDMCLAEVLVSSTHVKQVTFHMKSLPWFKSDVTDGDMVYLINTLKGHDDPNLAKLGALWDSRFADRTFLKTDHKFWTSSHSFTDLKATCPDLHDQLSKSDLVFFKGDLNYRKLVNDRMWPYDTTFQQALEGFNPSKICALRTIKSDSIVSVDEAKVKSVIKSDVDLMFNGHFALISSNL